MAPEIFAGQKLSEKADVFSYGVVMWEVVTGDVPRMRLYRERRWDPRVITTLLHELPVHACPPCAQCCMMIVAQARNGLMTC